MFRLIQSSPTGILAAVVLLAAAIAPMAAAPRAATAAGNSVAIVDFAFSSDPITVAAGDTVTWSNGDIAVHDVTATDGAWSSGIMAPGGSFSRTFSEAGTYAYRCNLHPYMTGTVIVAGQ